MYRYIGNKSKLLPHIIDKINRVIGDKKTVVDLMAGTGLVALSLRKAGYSVIASDMMTYSYHHLNVHLKLSAPPQFQSLPLSNSSPVTMQPNRYEQVLIVLNHLEPVKGFFYNEFSPEGTPKEDVPPRKYFSAENAGKIDAIRLKIKEWLERGFLSDLEESLLKHTLIMAVNEVANISGTYGHYLASLNLNARQRIELRPVEFEESNPSGHQVHLEFAEKLAADIKADLCYIDPPYMKRQYAANYHILETIARGDEPDAKGKSGLRDWWDQHSKLCTKTQGLQSLKTIFDSMDCPLFLVSYSEDGLFTLEQLTELFETFGEVEVDIIDHNRFRSNESPLPKTLREYLISVRKK